LGLNPEKFGVQKAKETNITFADNDVEHIDPTGTNHDAFSYGLKKSLFNYMHSIGLDEPLHKWFDHKTPKPSVPADFIVQCLQEATLNSSKPNTKVVFIGTIPSIEIVSKSKKEIHGKKLNCCFKQTKKRYK
jgi:hypothetical protein